MIPPFTLDQLLVFVTVVDTGSLSRAARQLHRTQSAISKTIATLENQLDIRLFERSAQGTSLTEAGAALVLSAKEVLAGRDLFAAEVTRVQGAEHRVQSLALDALFPVAPLLHGLTWLQRDHPDVPIILRTEALTRLTELVATGICGAGIVGPQGSHDASFEREYLCTTWMVPVCSPSHPLASIAGDAPLPQAQLRQHTHIYMTDRTIESGHHENVADRQWWKTTSLMTKIDCLEQGLGWGLLPHHQLPERLRNGTLASLQIEGWPRAWSHAHFLVTRRDAPPSPVLAELLSRVRAHLEAEGSSSEEWEP